MIYKQNENGRTKTNITKILGSRLKLGFLNYMHFIDNKCNTHKG